MKISVKIYSVVLLNFSLWGTYEGYADKIIISCPKANDYTYNSPNWSAPSTNSTMVYSFYIQNASRSIKLLHPIKAEVQKNTDRYLITCTYSANPEKNSRAIAIFKAQGWVVPRVAKCEVENQTSIACTL